jgi:uncharacterized protein
MSEAFVRLHLMLFRHRRLVLIAVALLVGCTLLLSRRLKLSEDYTDMLPMAAPAIAHQVEALKHVRQADRVFVDVESANGDPAHLEEAAERMAQALTTISELTDIRGKMEADAAQELLAAAMAQLPLLLTKADLQTLEKKLKPEAIRGRLQWFRKNLSQPHGLMLQETLRADPVGLADPVLAHLRALQTSAGDGRLSGGLITSADGRHVLITAVPVFRPSETKRSRKLVPELLREARKVESAFPAGVIRVSVSGGHRVALDNATMIQTDSTRTSIFATTAVAALMLVAYRRRWLSLLGLLPTAFGGLAAILAFYLSGEAVSGIAIGCGSILIGVTVDYGIYVLYHSEDSPVADRLGLARAVAAMGPTVTFGALTTLSAFVVMFASPVSGHRQLGVFGIVAVGTAAMTALVFLPLFIPTKRHGSAQALPLTRLMTRLFALRMTQARWVLPVLGVFSILAVVGILRLRFDGNLSRFNGVSPATAKAEQQIGDTWGKALSLTTIVVSGETREQALQHNETLFQLLTKAAATSLVDGFSSIAPLVPSAQSRAANLQNWKEFWTPVRQQEISNTLFVAGSEVGLRPEAFSGFLGRIAAPYSGELPGNPAFNRLVGEYSDERTGTLYFLTLAKINSVASFNAVQDLINRTVPGALLLNKTALAEEITRIARRGLPIFGALVVALNFLLLYLFLGRGSLVAVTLLPMGAGVLWSLGILGLCGVPIDMSNFIFVILVVGLGGDYSLFLVTAELDTLRGNTNHTASTGAAVTLCALTTVFGVGALVLAKHPALFSIGLAALLGISLSLVATLLLVPLCMGLVRRRAERLARQAVQSAHENGPVSAARVALLYHYQEPYVTQFVSWKMRLDPVFKTLDQVVPKSCSALDLGCGFGLAAHWLTLSSEQRSVIGFDRDVSKLRVARATAVFNPRVRFEERDVLTADYPASDCVVMCDLLHYLPHEKKAEVLSKAAAALRPGGVLVLRDALKENSRLHRLVAFSESLGVRLGQNKTAYGLHFESRESHLQLLRGAGFDVVRTLDEAGLGSNVLLVCRKSP